MKKAKQWKKPEVGVREFTKPSSESVLSSSGVRSFVGHPVGPPSVPDFTKPSSKSVLSSSGVRSFVGYPVGPPSAPSPATNDLSLEGR